MRQVEQAYPSTNEMRGGFTKREKIAAMVMQGLLSSGQTVPNLSGLDEIQQFVAEVSVGYADALLKELNK